MLKLILKKYIFIRILYLEKILKNLKHTHQRFVGRSIAFVITDQRNIPKLQN